MYGERFRFLSGVGCGKTRAFSEVAHSSGLMSFQAHVGCGLAGARQNKPGLFVRLKVRPRQALIDCAAQQLCRARQAASLMADGRKGDSILGRCIPNRFGGAAPERILALRCVENNEVIACYFNSPCQLLAGRFTDSATGHSILRVIEAAVFAVRRFARFAPPEVT